MQSQNSKNSLPLWSKQLISFNKNFLEMLEGLSKMSSSNEKTISINYSDPNGNATTYNVTSIGYLKSEVDRLDRNIQALSGISSSATIQINGVAFKKIIVADLNKQPNSISDLNIISNFYTRPNWIFDSLIDPMLLVELDLENKIASDVRKIFSRRYIINFEKDSTGVLTTAGSSAQTDFTQRWKNKSDIDIVEFNDWLNIIGISDYRLDEQQFELEPNYLKYRGLFTVLQVEEDTVNRKLWYVIDGLDYIEVSTGNFKQIKVGDDFAINAETSQTIYRLVEISTLNNRIRVRFDRIQGNDAIPVAVGALKIYSDVINNQRVRISVSNDEYNVIFVKAINNNFLLSDEWSQGSAFYTNELKYIDESSQGLNDVTLQEFYNKKAYDYGSILLELVQKKIPSTLGVIPNAPILDINSFAVKQINKHLTNTKDNDKIRELQTQKETIKSEINALNSAIMVKNSELVVKKIEIEARKK
jgi:DNA-dependent RNA polymerase auxiliary subunit epsilon